MSTQSAPAVTAVEAAMALPDAVSWDSAVWVGTIDDVEFAAGRQAPVGLLGYRSARFLVRSGRIPRGFVETPVADGRIDTANTIAAIAALPPVQQAPKSARPAISVVLCTLDRPGLLTTALGSLLRMDYPDFEIVVVDNNPASGVTPAALQALHEPRIRLVSEPRRGLAIARNTGAVAASNAHVAFTDDDVAVDAFWLHGIADGFAAGSDVACVSGIVPSGQIISASQAYFDRRVSWARNCRAELFSMDTRRRDEPLFPFQVGRFGTGANFAVRRDVLLELGGFDEGLGIGSACGGGEDIDMFVRVLLAGRQLAYEPSALVWHRHRPDLESLTAQITDYGTGLGAWLTKLALQPGTLVMMLRRLLPGLRHLRRVTHVDADVSGLMPEHDDLWRVERRAVLLGPLALLQARRAGASARPLLHSARSARSGRAVPREET